MGKNITHDIFKTLYCFTCDIPRSPEISYKIYTTALWPSSFHSKFHSPRNLLLQHPAGGLISYIIILRFYYTFIASTYIHGPSWYMPSSFASLVGLYYYTGNFSPVSHAYPSPSPLLSPAESAQQYAHFISISPSRYF